MGEKLGLLSILEEAVDIEAGLIFTGANFLIASGPTLLVLQICGFFPKAEGIVILPEALFVLGSTAVGVAFFVLGFIASILQTTTRRASRSSAECIQGEVR